MRSLLEHCPELVVVSEHLVVLFEQLLVYSVVREIIILIQGVSIFFTRHFLYLLLWWLMFGHTLFKKYENIYMLINFLKKGKRAVNKFEFKFG